jgi:Zn finger protein HypA/HybF involved in hydrogenase expression
MHELSYVETIITQVKSHATSHHAKKINNIVLEINVSSGIEEESFKFYWNIATTQC